MKKQLIKEKTVGVRYSVDEFKRIEARARQRGMNVAEHIRDLSRRDLEREAA